MQSRAGDQNFRPKTLRNNKESSWVSICGIPSGCSLFSLQTLTPDPDLKLWKTKVQFHRCCILLLWAMTFIHTILPKKDVFCFFLSLSPLSLSPNLSRTHSHTRTHTYTYTHTCAHARTHAHTGHHNLFTRSGNAVSSRCLS